MDDSRHSVDASRSSSKMVAESYERKVIEAESHRKAGNVRKEIEVNRKLISLLERNVREHGWEPFTALTQMQHLIKTNANLVDNAEAANNYAEFCVPPGDANATNHSRKWKSSVCVKSPLFKNVIEKHKNLPTTRQPLWDIDLRRRIVSSLASLNSTGGSSSSSRLERHAGGSKASLASSGNLRSLAPSLPTNKSSTCDEPNLGLARSVGAANSKNWSDGPRLPSPATNARFVDKLTGGSGGVGGSRGFGVGGSSGLGGSNSFGVGLGGSSGGGAARILNAAGGYNRAPRPVYPASNRRNSPNYGGASIGGNPRSDPAHATAAGKAAVPSSAFRTAHEKLVLDQQANKKANGDISQASYGGGVGRKCLGTRPGPASGFKPPVKQEAEDPPGLVNQTKPQTTSAANNNYEEMDERYKNIDPKMIEQIMNEIMDTGSPVNWDDIAGLAFQKETVKEIVVLPMLRPDIFTGIRAPPKGLLLFGPPGTGKTLIGKCIASQSKSTFFSISASSLTSKWVGEGEKMVRALFAVARVHQPSVIFIDEIDSLLSARSESEHESSRRMKTEFLVQLDGASTVGEERILIVGATNRPQELDEAARRRLVKRLLIPLPENEARKQIIARLIGKEKNCLSESDIDEISSKTDGYSGADMFNLCREAAMGPIRSIAFSQMEMMQADQVRPINKEDLLAGLRQVKASVSDQDLEMYEDWNNKYGAGK